jgi:hypothetical protein
MAAPGSGWPSPDAPLICTVAGSRPATPTPGSRSPSSCRCRHRHHGCSPIERIRQPQSRRNSFDANFNKRRGPTMDLSMQIIRPAYLHESAEEGLPDRF